MTPCAEGGRPLALAVIMAATSLPARAQTLPSEPIVFGDGRLTVGGDAAVSFAPQDPGFFNYTDYEHSTLRMLRIDLTAALKADDHLSFLADMRSENVDSPRPYALYARIRPWTHARSTSRSAASRRPSARSPGAPTRRTIC